MAKRNCWEVMNCGRERGGSKVKDLGECPAAVDTRANGIHGGVNGGRACWVLSGTLCGGKVQGTYASKLQNCMKCNFYEQVRVEGGGNALSSTKIMAKIKEKS